MLARYGVPEYWIVDPRAQTIEMYWLQGGDYALAATSPGHEVARSTVLNGLEVEASAIFVGTLD